MPGGSSTRAGDVTRRSSQPGKSAPALAFDESSEWVRLCLEQPHDEGRWKVWADALLDAGDALGERVARGRGADPADDAKALGPLARGFVDGGVELEWRHGFIRRAVQGYAQARPAYWSRQEFAAAGLICALVFGSTFPLVVPFMVMQEPWLALRVSHAIAVIMLFILGWKLGRWSGASAIGSGTLLATVGVVLAVLCVALGG